MLLIRFPGVVFSREELTRRIAESAQLPHRRIIDVLVRRIRAKIETCQDSPRYLRTVRGLGYRFQYSGQTFLDAVSGEHFPQDPCAPSVTNL
jgi:two-component system alkaline phosphatase synthesis response regulator PhoP